VSDALDLCVKASLAVGVVADLSDSAIGLVERVLALDDIAVSRLPLALVVVGVWVLDAIFELVLWIGVIIAFVVGA
jgi:hypothetical protein